MSDMAAPLDDAAMGCCETVHSKWAAVCFQKNTRFQKEQKAAPYGLSQTWSDKLRAGRQVAVWRVKQHVTLSEEEECWEIRRRHCAGQQQ